jgi:hypothetical protein
MSEPVLGKNGRTMLRALVASAKASRDRGSTPVTPQPARRSDLLGNIQAIAAYTGRHAELQQAHHFLYDLRSPQDGVPEYVVMGVNPGETQNDWAMVAVPTEETSRYDFHEEHGRGRSSIRWSRAASYFLDGADHVLTELFFWSSRDHVEFKRRYGKLRSSPHLAFCVRLNGDLVEAYRPKAIVLPGLGHRGLCATGYGLTRVRTVHCADVRVAGVYDDGQRPWVFTKHWTAAYGFSQSQREAVRNAIREASDVRLW